MTLISTVGGASGALYGTFFLQASTLAGGRTELSPSEFGSLSGKRTWPESSYEAKPPSATKR